ncbi:MAG: hypothetical protein KDK89_19715 [Alphaproteobacteria bacterium]|nr:hypothetical protein [Alphaproteobacteria bacterium]
MRRILAAILFCASATAAQADCPLDKIEAALAASLDAMRPLEREVSDVQSTEGGLWQIYREKDGRVNTILRIDAGESGRSETRLSIVNRKTYGIARTRVDYLRHAFVEEGPFGIARRTVDYFYYCDGRAHVPAGNGAMVDLVEYPKAADEAQRDMILNADVADFTKGLAR